MNAIGPKNMLPAPTRNSVTLTIVRNIFPWPSFWNNDSLLDALIDESEIVAGAVSKLLNSKLVIA